MTKKLEFCDLTVVIPAFNCEGTLSRALASVCNQTLLPTSIFVIDDRSTDKTFEVGMKFMESNHLLNVQVFQNKINLGPGPTRNFGWNLATSKYIAFLDADDAWDPRKLEIQVEWMEAHKNIDFTCTRTRLSETHADFQYPGFVATEIDFKKMLFRNSVPTRTVIIHRKITQRFASGLSEDFALWLRMLRNGKCGVKLEIPLAVHFRPEFSKGGISSAIFKHEFYEIANISRYFLSEPIFVPLAIVFSIMKFFRRLFISLARDLL